MITYCAAPRLPRASPGAGNRGSVPFTARRRRLPPQRHGHYTTQWRLAKASTRRPGFPFPQVRLPRPAHHGACGAPNEAEIISHRAQRQPSTAVRVACWPNVADLHMRQILTASDEARSLHHEVAKAGRGSPCAKRTGFRWSLINKVLRSRGLRSRSSGHLGLK
jgi:hypothetical protein